MMSRLWCGSLISTVGAFLLASTAMAAPSVCATPEQKRQVQLETVGGPSLPPSQLAAKLDLTEAVVLSGLPVAWSKPLAPSAFRDVWSQLTTWNVAITLIPKDGHALQVLSKIYPLDDGNASGAANVRPTGMGLAGQIQQNSIGGIFVVSLPNQGGGNARGVFFMNTNGYMSFGVMVPIAGGKVEASTLERFEKLWASADKMPSLCN